MTNDVDGSAASDCSLAVRGSLAAALHARRGEKIGRIVEAWKWGPYKTGDYVFVWDYGTDYTTSLPMTPEQIAKEQSKGSGLRDWLTVMSVPKRYVEIVL